MIIIKNYQVRILDTMEAFALLDRHAFLGGATEKQVRRIRAVITGEDGNTWKMQCALYYRHRHAAKQLLKKARNAKRGADRNDMNSRRIARLRQMADLRSHFSTKEETTYECWRRELMDLRARVTQADAYRTRGIEFRPLFLLCLAEMEIAAQIAAHFPEYFIEQYLLLPGNSSEPIGMVKHFHKPGLNDL